MSNPHAPKLHLDHLALRGQFSSAIWGVREVYGLILQKRPDGWTVDLIPEDYEDESSGPFIYHPDSEAIWEALQSQHFPTRRDAVQAISLAWEIQDLKDSGAPSSPQAISTRTVSVQSSSSTHRS